MKRIAWALGLVGGFALAACEIGGDIVGACGNIGDGDGTGGGPTGSGEGGGDDGGIKPFSSRKKIPCAGIAMTTLTGGVRVALEVPSGSYLHSVSATVVPPGEHEELPLLLPVIQFTYSTHELFPDSILMSSIRDAPISIESYEQPHRVLLDVAPNGPGVPIDNDAKFYEGVGIGESSAPGTVFADWICDVTLGNCIDAHTGATMPDGSACGEKSACEGGECAE